jgi:ubiquitin-protein ligase
MTQEFLAFDRQERSTMHQSPRIRRLKNDLAALERLRDESSVFRFTSKGDPPQHYMISFKGKSLWRDQGHVRILEQHHIEIRLGASYPRTIPELRWMTPIYHPNISEIGMVCLGGYGTHWVPSIQIDELCQMLWDMARYHNYDVRSPYNRDAALWVASQTKFLFPLDPRPIRDLRVALGRIDPAPAIADSKQVANPLHHEPEPKVDRVRRFVARYGLVFKGPDSTQPTGDAPADQGLAVAAPEPKREAPLPLAAVADVANNTHDDLVVLNDSHAVHRAPAAARPDGGEILFIE